VIGGDFTRLSAEEKEGVGPIAGDFDVGFVTGALGIGFSLIGKIEAVAMVGGGLAVVENGLICNGDLEDFTHD